MSLNFFNMMPKKDSVSSEFHVKQELTLELFVFISVCYSELEVTCKNLEEAEVETCLKTIILLLCMTFLTPNGDMTTIKIKHIWEELFYHLKFFWLNTHELSLRIHQSMPSAMVPNLWFLVSWDMITTLMSELKSSLCQLKVKPLLLPLLKWLQVKLAAVIMVLLLKQKELSWTDKHTLENGRKGQEPRENKLLSNKENFKRTENQMLILLKIGWFTTIPKRIKT